MQGTRFGYEMVVVCLLITIPMSLRVIFCIIAVVFNQSPSGCNVVDDDMRRRR